jgi:16S rRNA processing protein RimM
MAEKLVAVGSIVGTHGVKGELKIIPYFEPVAQYEGFEALYVKTAGGEKKKFSVERIRFHKQFIIIKLEGCASINEAQSLRNNEIEIPSERLPLLQEGEFYWHDLIGMSVHDETGDCLGKVKDIFPTGSNDVIVVRHEDEELLLPAIREVVLKIDLNENRITVRPQEFLE